MYVRYTDNTCNAKSSTLKYQTSYLSYYIHGMQTFMQFTLMQITLKQKSYKASNFYYKNSI